MRFQVKEDISCGDCGCSISKENKQVFFYKTKEGAVLCQECYNLFIETEIEDNLDDH